MAPWSVRLETAKLVSKMTRVSARCRLSLDEEKLLLAVCDGLKTKEAQAKCVVVLWRCWGGGGGYQ